MPSAQERIEAVLPAQAGLEDLMRRHPEAWARTGEALVAALETGRAEEVAAFLRQARASAQHWRERLTSSGGNPRVLEAALPHLAAERMALLAVERTSMAALAGRAEGILRLSLWDGLLVQKLLFGRGLERKSASLGAFRLIWPLVRRKRLVMPLLQQRGIYCFYSRELIRALVEMLAGRTTLEVAAGDGTLSRMLRAEGAEVRATDDQSWSRRIEYPQEVEKLGAVEALERYRPSAVLCSWPPPGNRFESRIFETDSVELYVAVTSRHRFAAGNWKAYERQIGFEGGLDDELSRLVLPPEIDPAVLVFRRR
jgi:hypothetical protein